MLCLSHPSPPSLPLDPPVWKNVPARVETGLGARDSTYWKHPGVSCNPCGCGMGRVGFSRASKVAAH